MEKMFGLTLIFLSLSGGHSDSHSLHLFSTWVSVPGPGVPALAVVGYVDDQQILLYNSDISRTVPVAPWMKDYKIPEYWESQSMKFSESIFKHEVRRLTKQLNYTRGFHFVQVMFGCELTEDGSTVGYLHFGYDGTQIMYLDLQKATYVPTMAEAQTYTQWLNSPDVREGERATNVLENECIEALTELLKHGREDLERRVRPEVKITGRESGEVTKLHCLVYGFHPRVVYVRWMKNGVEVLSYETTHVLPNPDGTYQIRVTMEVNPKNGDSYSCYVDHSSLEEPLLVQWEPKQDKLRAVIIGAVVVIVLVLLSVTAGVLIYRRKKVTYMGASREYTGMCSAVFSKERKSLTWEPAESIQERKSLTWEPAESIQLKREEKMKNIQ